MLHPILSNRSSKLLLYPLTLVLVAIQAALLYYYGNLSWQASLIDSVVYNVVMMLLGFSLWFPLWYKQKNCSTSRIVAHNFLAGFVAILLWIVVSGMVCGIFLGNDEHYILLTSRILPLRVLWGLEHILIIMLLYHFFMFYGDLEEKRLQEEVLKKQVKESELKTLKAQLNPHFLFNSLNSVSALTITDPKGARNMINQLSELLRYSLRNKHTDIISLADELNNIRRYMSIEKVRFGELLNYEENADPECLEKRLPAMILQPLFENSIKHGLYESFEPVTVKINCCVKGDNLEIVVANNCNDAMVSPRGEGLGLRNTANILRNLYNRDGLLKSGIIDNCFEVQMIIPQNI
jgi:two-component system, LytTR family, sensor kinase